MKLSKQYAEWTEYVATFGEPEYGLFDAPEYGLFRCPTCYEAPNPIVGWSFEETGELLGLIPQWSVPELQPLCGGCGDQMFLVAKLKPVSVSEHVPASDVPSDE
jgi:hypothetical protein